MYYVSTRNKEDRRTAAEAIAQGLAADGGLMTPEVFPKLSHNALDTMRDMSYQQRAVYVMNSYLDDFTASELSAYADKAYGGEKFDVKEVAPVRAVDENTYCLELWHGPTCAFKDMALQMLPHLLSASLVKNQEEKTVCILVATSGDTGKAALEGFKDVDKTRILVFYPKDGVSAIQELQMNTQEGDNVGVCSVAGNFDDAQTGVKRLFSDEALREKLAGRGFFLSSANSINWGRVLPQIVYYISAYCDLLREGRIQKGERINVCVPTGNFGNILAAYYAREMGVPIGRLICASNSNNVLTDFLCTGVYDRNRTFYNTMSPSMDLSHNALDTMRDMSYQQRAVYVMNSYLDDFTASELSAYADKAYGGEKFDVKEVAPVRAVDENTYCLELWHGPTCAFKDMALQMLPHLLSASLVKNQEEKTVCILVATSGDTGKAALEGFKDVDKTRILVFYPKDGVSAIQELQMNTQEGDNVGVCSVAGNFDDAQTGVKRLFSDEALREKLAGRGFFLSSANSINWGRVLPQIVYYISAYCDLLREGRIQKGERINVCVPTGNFGNILAAYYAREMGVPIGRLICASNSNNVLTDFLCTGVYDRNRTFYNTMSPSMDILISSNLERLLFSLSNHDDAEVRGYMEELARSGRYEVSPAIKGRLEKLFAAGFCDDAQTQKVIGRMWQEHRYLIDPHTAVAFDVLDQYRRDTGDTTPTVVVSTASPFKFCDSVLGALGVSELAAGTAILDQLSQQTGVPVPAPLAALKDKTVRFGRSVTKEHMVDQVLEMLR